MKIKNVVLIPNKAKDCDGSYTEQVSNIFTSRGCRVEIGNITPMTDLAVVLGGDGSMLRAARNASARGIPLLGINLGRVGYMTETEIGDLGVLDRLFDGDYRIESRMMLDVIVPDERYGTRRLVALNDAVLASGVVTKMIDIGVDVDGSAACRYYADGIIVATPTGSTAYSLSAGGPVIDPVVHCISVTPVSAHSLTARPMIFSSESKLEIFGCGRREGKACLTVDGGVGIMLPRGSRGTVKKSSRVTKLLVKQIVPISLRFKKSCPKRIRTDNKGKVNVK